MWSQQPVQLRSTSTDILIGDQITVWLEYRQKGQDLKGVNWPLLPDTLPGLMWVEQNPLDTLVQNDSSFLRQKLIITGFDSGRYVLPALAFNIKGQNYYTDSLPINVATLEVDTSKAFKPIKSVKDLPMSWRDYWRPVTLVLSLLLLLIGLGYYLYRRWKKGGNQKDTVPPEKAHATALRELSILEKKELWQHGQVKAYYDELSRILRNYLENRFDLNALEKTSDDLLRETRKMKELKAFRKPLRLILQTADLAKFAKANPTEEQHLSCLQATRDLIIKTKLTKEEDHA